MTLKTRIKQLTATQKAFHKKWLLALRSPRKYPKTQGSLRDIRGFCCLGVGLDLCKVEWDAPDSDAGDETYDIMGRKRDLKDCEALSHKGRAKFGLTQAEMNDLASLNDRVTTFAPVREYIRNLMKHREQHYREGREG